MYVSARTDYAVRAMLGVASAEPGLVKAASLAAAQEIPLSFLQGSCWTCAGPGCSTAIAGWTAAISSAGRRRRSAWATSCAR